MERLDTLAALHSGAMNDVSSVPALSTALTIGFAVALVASLLLKFWLATRQMRHVAQHRGAVPAAFADRITLASHQKAADYTIAQGRLGLLELAWGTVVTLGWTLMGGLSALNQLLGPRFASGIAQQVALLAAFTIINTVIDLPFSLYRTFVLSSVWLQQDHCFALAEGHG